MKFRSIISIILFASAIAGLQAQEVVDAAGGEASGGGGTLSYSVGQLNYTAVDNSNGSVMQGVQMAYEIFITTGMELEHINLGFSAFPNPTRGQLFLEIDNYDNEKISYQIFDVQGRMLEEKLVTEGRTQINIDRFAKSTYFLKIYDYKNILKTFKIIKN